MNGRRRHTALRNGEASISATPSGRAEIANRFPCFDGIRAIAVSMVIVYHAVFFTTWFDTRGGTVLWNLNGGVWIFFVTSGFLLYRPFAVSHLTKATTVDVRGYAIRRVARIYPAYWAVLVFFTFAVPRLTIVGMKGFFLNTTLTQGYVETKNAFFVGLPPAWSLVVEMTFYAFLPFYAAAIAALARRRDALTVELVGVGVLFVLGVAAIVAMSAGYAPAWFNMLPIHLAAFALGIVLAVVSSAHFGPTTERRLAWAGRVTWLWWTLAMVAFLSIPLCFRVVPFRDLSIVQNAGLNLLQTLIGFFVVIPAVLGPQHEGAIRRLLTSRVLVFVGTISYGLYLWHWFVLRTVQADWYGWRLREGNYVKLLALALPVALVAATASWYLLERPILDRARALAHLVVARRSA